MKEAALVRTVSLLLVLVAVLSLVTLPAASSADTGSISRDSRGISVYGTQDPLGGPPTPRVYGLGQPTIFFAGVLLLVAAAALGAYTFLSARKPGHR